MLTSFSKEEESVAQDEEKLLFGGGVQKSGGGWQVSELSALGNLTSRCHCPNCTKRANNTEGGAGG